MLINADCIIMWVCLRCRFNSLTWPTILYVICLPLQLPLVPLFFVIWSHWLSFHFLHESKSCRSRSLGTGCSLRLKQPSHPYLVISAHFSLGWFLAFPKPTESIGIVFTLIFVLQHKHKKYGKAFKYPIHLLPSYSTLKIVVLDIQFFKILPSCYSYL